MANCVYLDELVVIQTFLGFLVLRPDFYTSDEFLTNFVYSGGMINVFVASMIMVDDKFRYAMSSRKNYWPFGVV